MPIMMLSLAKISANNLVGNNLNFSKNGKTERERKEMKYGAEMRFSRP
jgi:hypothetical protein